MRSLQPRGRRCPPYTCSRVPRAPRLGHSLPPPGAPHGPPAMGQPGWSHPGTAAHFWGGRRLEGTAWPRRRRCCGAAASTSRSGVPGSFGVDARMGVRGGGSAAVGVPAGACVGPGTAPGAAAHVERVSMGTGHPRPRHAHARVCLVAGPPPHPSPVPRRPPPSDGQRLGRDRAVPVPPPPAPRPAQPGLSHPLQPPGSMARTEP